MNIQINLTISADPALLAALQALSGGKTQSAVVTEPKVKKSKPIEEPVNDAKPITTEEVKPESQSNEADTNHTLESLRAIAVPKSRAGKKDEIKAWLTEAGYPDGLATLQPKDFDAFYSFIEKL